MSDNLWTGEERRLAEEDRRQICFLHRDTFNELKEDVAELFDRAEEAGNFRSQVKLAGVVALIVISAPFIYSYNHQVDAATARVVHRALIDANTAAVSDIRGDYKAILVEIRNLTKEISRSNDQNEKLINAMVDSNRRYNEIKNFTNGYDSSVIERR